MKSKAVILLCAKNKQRKGWELTDEEKRILFEANAYTPRKRTPKKRIVFSPKDKAKYAIEKRGGEKWMQQWIDWEDKSIPLGMRRVAFVRYMTMVKGKTLQQAKYDSVKYIH